MNQHQELAIRALGNMMGDNTARARAAFRNRTPEQMQEQYGQSAPSRAAAAVVRTLRTEEEKAVRAEVGRIEVGTPQTDRRKLAAVAR
jgi:hypothetical protein